MNLFFSGMHLLLVKNCIQYHYTAKSAIFPQKSTTSIICRIKTYTNLVLMFFCIITNHNNYEANVP